MDNHENIRLLNILKSSLHLDRCMCYVVETLGDKGKISYDEMDTLFALIENNPPVKRYDVESAFIFLRQTKFQERYGVMN